MRNKAFSVSGRFWAVSGLLLTLTRIKHQKTGSRPGFLTI